MSVDSVKYVRYYGGTSFSPQDQWQLGGAVNLRQHSTIVDFSWNTADDVLRNLERLRLPYEIPDFNW